MSAAAERYRQAKAIFLQSLQHAPEARAGIVHAACGDDAELRREVEALLADDSTRGAALDRLDEAQPAPKLPPDYRVLRELGRGGMGVVWLAERDSGDFKQKVALKLLGHDALRDPDRRARFRAERRILASLDHPHIARLLDGGALADGTPYLAMEFVEGERLDAWVERARPDLRALLRLFVAICRAVQAAHQRLVVHRDLKPANILVDAYGAPKLLDFGIAKLLDDSAEVEVATGTGMQLLTPRYAAPEQVRGEAITTATDVYALGVILYELLTGSSPYGKASATPDQLRAICDTDPLRPSLVASEAAHPTSGTASARLRGDLDAILLKCLRKAPAARYRGAAELADDLEAFLDGRPVAARAGSTRYAVSKFVGRHRYLVASTLLVLGVLLAATMLLRQQLEETRKQRDLAAQERDRAEAVTRFMTGVFREADPYRNDGRQLSAIELVRRGAERIAGRDDLAPEIRGSIETVLASVNHNLGDVDAAMRLAEAAVERLRPMSARDPLPLARALHELGTLKDSKGRYDEAMRDYQEGIDVLGPGNAVTRASLLRSIGLTERERNNVSAANARRAEAFSVLIEHLGFPTRDAAVAGVAPGDAADLLAQLMQNECGALEQERELEAALAVCEQTLALKRRLYPGQRVQLQATLSVIVNVYSARGEFVRAAETGEELLRIAEEVFGPEHPQFAIAALNLGSDLRQSGQTDRALELYQRAVDIFTRVNGAEHRFTLIARNNLANIHMGRKEYERALALHREILDIRKRVLGEQSPEIGQSLINISICEQGLGRHDVAVSLMRDAVAQYERTRGSDHFETELTRVALANALMLAGQHAEAARIAEAARAKFEGDGENELVRALISFIVAHEKVLDPDQRESAIRDVEAALAVAEKQPNNDFLVPADVREWLQQQARDAPR